ncbi:MAG: TonB-dependent receptor, partial [Ignavibacteriales bacterium]
MRFKSACMLAASIFAVSATAAYAQEVQEVIVTAQKREQNLQEVPITVTAATAQTLEAAVITNSRDLTLITPGLNFANNTSTGTPVIRGVATRGVGPGDEPSVPVYIDGVYQSSTHSGFFSFNNVERIEVLKGPQGTLFGRNAVGGAINIITYQPTFDFEGKADVSYGTDNEVQANVYLSGPLSEKLAANIAFHHDNHDGYVHDVYTGEDKASAKSDGVRAKLLWRPTDKIDVTVGASSIRSEDDSAFSGYPLDGNTIAASTPGVIIAGKGETSVGDTYFKVKQDGAFANLVWDFDKFQLTALTSWLDTKSILRTDSDISNIDYSYAKFPTVDTSYTTEIRLASTGVHKLDWIAGVNFFRDEGAYALTDDGDVFVARSTPRGPTVGLVSNIDTNAYAVFGEATYHLTDALSVTGGVRYNNEERSKEMWRSITPYASLPAAAQTPDYNITIN